MDGFRFDRLARVLAASMTRRSTVGVSLAGLLVNLGNHATVANSKNKKKRRKRKRRCRKCDACERCNKKGKCTLRNGRLRLENGSCARSCAEGQSCGVDCNCTNPDPENRQFCQQNGPCADLTECTETEQCPKGFYCNEAFCGPTRRCTPLCPL